MHKSALSCREYSFLHFPPFDLCRNRNENMATDIKDTGVPVEVLKLPTQVSFGEEIASAVAIEHTLSFWEALKLYPKAIGWSMYFSMGVIMLGMRPLIFLAEEAKYR
jgi:hypothetical protein